MTDRVHGLVVTLDGDYRDDDVQAIVLGSLRDESPPLRRGERRLREGVLMADAVAVEKTAMEQVAEVLPKLWSKTNDGTATVLETEAYAALLAIRTEMQRVDIRIQHAKDKLAGAVSYLEGEWG